MMKARSVITGWWIAGLLLGGSSVPAQTIWYVSPDGDDSAGTDWGTAFHAIQSAVDAAADNDRIMVSNGVYATGGRGVGAESLTNRLVIDKAVTVESLNGPEHTFIVGAPHSPTVPHGDAAVRCVYLAHDGAVLSGFTLTNGHTRALGNVDEAYGGAIFAPNTSPIVTNCVLIGNRANTRAGGAQGATLIDCRIENNHAAGAGAARNTILIGCTVVSNTAPSYSGGTINSTAYDSLFIGNQGPDGGAMWAGSAHNCRFFGNRSTGNGGATSGTGLNNCLLIGNRAAGSGGATSGGSLRHCTIIGNRAGISAGGTLNSLLLNSIVYYNEAPFNPNWSGGGDSRYSCADPVTPGAGSIAGPPGIVGINNPRLLPNSPCIDAGSAGIETAGTHDVEGNPRNSGVAPDMGAYETTVGTHTGILTAAVLSDVATAVVGVPVPFAADVHGRAAAVIWSFNDGTPALTNVCAVVRHAFQSPGQYDVTVTATHADMTVVSAPHTLTIVSAADAVAYVNVANTAPEPPYNTWARAATAIQDAVDAVPVGGRVRVADGVYATGGRVPEGAILTNRVLVDHHMTIESVNGPEHTWIVGAGPQGAGAVRGVLLADGASLIGFTITNGHTHLTSASDPWLDRTGGGILAGEFSVISNCVIVDGSARVAGGGVYGGQVWDSLIRGNVSQGSGGGVSHAVVYRSRLDGNTAGDGGGAFQSRLTDCVVSTNAGSAGGGAYGGFLDRCVIRNNISPRGAGVFQSTVVNSLIVSNVCSGSPGWGGGARESVLVNCTVSANSASARGGGSYLGSMTNSIVWGNTAPDGPEYWGAATFAFSCSLPKPAGVGNIDDDPRFADPANGNFRLSLPLPHWSVEAGDWVATGLHFSPCLHAATNLPWMADALDLDGNPRVSLGLRNSTRIPAPDMGAYEALSRPFGTVLSFR